MVLFVSDLDGTLLNDASVIEAASIDRLNNLIGAGVHFTIATARAYPSIASILDGLELRLPVIEQNGALLRDYSTGHVIDAKLMLSSDVADVCAIFEENDAAPAVSSLDGDENIVLYGKVDNSGMEWAITSMLDAKHARPMIEYDTFDRVISSSVLMFRYLGPEDKVRSLANKIRDAVPNLSVSRFHNFFTGGWEINVSGFAANKGEALKSLRPHAEGISRVVVFGDSDNDMDMFHHADESYAVANAGTEVRQKADATIGLNTDDAVISFIEQRVSSLRL